MSRETISRKEARERGLKRYYTGKPCKYNHVEERLVSNGSCMECARIKSMNQYYNNTEVCRERARNYKEKHRDHCREHKRQWYKDNRDHCLKYAKEYSTNNKERVIETRKRYRALNSHKVSFWSNNYRSRKLQATPKWADKDEIEYIYKLATEKNLTVDHMVPLSSPYVCGLHTGDNLRCIPSELNSYKGNRYWPDMPEELVNLEEE